MKRRKKFKFTAMRVLCIALAALMVAVSSAVIFKMDASKQKLEAAEYKSQVDAAKTDVYVASTDLKAGTKLTLGATDANGNVTEEANMTKVSGLSDPSFGTDIYVTDADAGKRISVDITANQPILKNELMSDDVTDSLRKTQMDFVELQDTQAPGDVVDVKIVYADGEVKTVVPKKEVQWINEDRTKVQLNLTEDNLLNIASAMLDTYLIPGTKMFTVDYVANGQKEATVDYTPRQETLALLLKDDTLGLKGDPNVEVGLTQDEVNVASAARQELEVYLDGLSTEQKKIMLEKFTKSGSADIESFGSAQSSSGNNITFSNDYSSYSDSSATGSSATSSSDNVNLIGDNMAGSSDTTTATDSAVN